MNSAEYVGQQIDALKKSGIPLSKAAWKAALLCVGWPYIFGDRGEYCTPTHRKAVFLKHTDRTTIISKCQALKLEKGQPEIIGNCNGCKWYPGGKKVRSYDCRGFTYWILLQIFGWKLQGSGCTSQWNNEANWKTKGEVSDGIPQGVIICLFYYKKDKYGKRTKTLEHTGLYYNGETCECSNGVQHSKTLNKKWEVWGIPACEGGEVPPEPKPEPGTAEVTGKNVALRKEPSTSAVIIMRIKTGETVKLEKEPEPTWDYVSYKGSKGWMMREFLREEKKTAVVTGKHVALRVDPSKRAKIIMRIKTGETVILEEAPHDWDYVSYKGNKGWMMRQFLKEG